MRIERSELNNILINMRTDFCVIVIYIYNVYTYLYIYNVYTYLNKNQFANKENLEKKDHQCNFEDLIFKL